MMLCAAPVRGVLPAPPRCGAEQPGIHVSSSARITYLHARMPHSSPVLRPVPALQHNDRLASAARKLGREHYRDQAARVIQVRQ